MKVCTSRLAANPTNNANNAVWYLFHVENDQKPQDEDWNTECIYEYDGSNNSSVTHSVSFEIYYSATDQQGIYT